MAGGFAQANHGKAAPLRRMQPDDWVVFYSPKQRFGATEPCQCFTAIGHVADSPVVQVRVSDDFQPFRRKVAFRVCREASVLPLISQLEFLPDKKAWGFPLRFGFLSINRHDFDLIASQMLDSWP